MIVGGGDDVEKSNKTNKVAKNSQSKKSDWIDVTYNVQYIKMTKIIQGVNSRCDPRWSSLFHFHFLWLG